MMLSNFIKEHNLDYEVLQQTEIQVKYAGYIEKKNKCG
jgi:hypothetical protein